MRVILAVTLVVALLFGLAALPSQAAGPGRQPAWLNEIVHHPQPNQPDRLPQPEHPIHAQPDHRPAAPQSNHVPTPDRPDHDNRLPTTGKIGLGTFLGVVVGVVIAHAGR